MDFCLENEVLTIFLKGRLDTESAARTEENILLISEENPHKSIVFDATELQFIASSGLRTVLKIAKSEKDFSIINVTPAVYNVFEMTGFTKIINITKALRRINLEECELIGRGGMGGVYRVSEDEIVKVNYNSAEDENIKIELAKAKEAFLLGIPTAISFDIVDCGDGKKGVIYETIKSKTIGELIQSNPERLEELTMKYVAHLKALHSITTDNKIFNSAKESFADQLRNAAKHYTEEEAKELKRILDILPEGNTMVHGDGHPKNVMMQGDDAFWIDMEMMSIGHPIYDLMAISVLIKINSSDAAAIHMSGMDTTNLAKFKDCFIRHYFETEDEEMIAQYDSLLDALRLIRRAFATGFNSPMIERARPNTLKEMRELLFPHVDEVIEAVESYLSATK